MKFHKRLFSILLTLVMLLSLLPMGQVVYAAGETVENLRWNGNVAEWDAYPGATAYRVILDNYTTATPIVMSNEDLNVTSRDFSDYFVPGNKYRFSIMPIFGSDYGGWAYSEIKTIPGSIGTIPNVTVNAATKTASWSAVTGATGYDVWVMFGGYQVGVVKDIAETTYDLSNEVLIKGDGTYSVQVKAYKLERGNYLAEGKSADVYINQESGGTKYTVSFDGNGGGGTMDSLQVSEGTKYTLPSNGFTPPAGKKFYKWDKGNVGEEITIDSNITIKAEWIEDTNYWLGVYNSRSNHGKVKIIGGSWDSGWVNAYGTGFSSGREFTVSAQADSGYKFKEWQNEDGTIASTNMDYTFVLLNEAKLYVIFEEDVVTKTLESIAITTPPTKTTYTEGESFDKAGMVVTATYSDSTTAEVTSYTVSPSGALATTDTSVTISYTEGGVTKTATQAITVNAVSTPVAPTITTSALPGGKVGEAYNQALEATGDATITWVVESGNLPDGLTLAADGTISGTPSTAGDYTFTVKATNGAGSDTKSFTVTIVLPVEVVVTTQDKDGNVISTSGGEATADKTEVAKGETITVTVTPNPGFELESIEFSDGVTGSYQAGKVTSFTVPDDFTTSTGKLQIDVFFKETTSATTRTVTFKDGENTLSTQTVNEGDKATKPADPTKTGYTFGGWYADATFAAAFDFDQAITTNTTVYAKFTPITVTGISIKTPGKTAYTVGEALDVSGMTIKVDYSDGTSATIPVTAAMVSGFDSSAPATSQTLTITYEGKTTTYDVSISDTAPVTYDITVSAGANGTASASAASATAGTTITVTATPDSGYEIDKITWTPEGGSETDITSTKRFTMPAAKVTVNVSFKASSVTPPGPTTYTVTFKDGENTLSSQTVNEGDKATKPADPTKTGYTFNGWYADATFAAAFDFDQAITANTTVYAKFTDNSVTPPATITYTVTFDANGHGTAPSAQTVESGKTATKPADPTETGWTFGGWYKEAACSNAFNFSTPITGNITLYAKWTKDGGDPVPATKYTITYVLNGGTLDGKTGTVTVQVEDGAVITLPKPTRSGYTFDYWEGSRYEAGASYTVTGDHTFTAQWKANSTTGTDGKDTSPKTGDDSNLRLWVLLMLMSILGFITTVAVGRKKHQHSR